jgi:hypothetical protein
MQLAGRLAATLLALTWIVPVAQAAAPVPRNFTLLNGADQRKAIIDHAHEHQLRAIAQIFYFDNAKTLVSQRMDGFAHRVRASVIAYSKQQTGQ